MSTIPPYSSLLPNGTTVPNAVPPYSTLTPNGQIVPSAASPVAIGAASGQIPFAIGGVPLVDVEVPQNLEFIGGTQRLEVHNFPGGIRTIQALGGFPPDQITWDGIFLGPTAWQRAYQFSQMRLQGQKVVLSYGSWQWEGVVEQFFVSVQHEFLNRYHITFIPEKDLSTLPPPVNTVDANLIVQMTMMAISMNLPTSIFGDDLPLTLSGPLNSLLSVTEGGLLAAGNDVNLLDAGTVSNIGYYNGQVQSAGGVILQPDSPVNPTLSMMASASYVMSAASILSNAVTQPAGPQATVAMINPNLMTLAAQYYGDASRWPAIASANGLVDPMPTGQYQITIPATVPPETSPGIWEV